ncbi:Hypothetical predicted protein, partial [Marmota monax]
RGPSGGCSSGAGGSGGSSLEVQSSFAAPPGAAHSPPGLAAAIPGLPAGIMGGLELPFVLLALVLCQAPLGPAAPVPVGEGTVLAKMYPRGNHWAVGECPGRKSRALLSPEGSASPRGPVSASQRFRGRAVGLGLAPTLLLKHRPGSPKLHPTFPRPGKTGSLTNRRLVPESFPARSLW